MAELSLSDDESDSDIKYAVVMTNISQLEQTSEGTRSQIALWSWPGLLGNLFIG